MQTKHYVPGNGQQTKKRQKTTAGTPSKDDVELHARSVTSCQHPPSPPQPHPARRIPPGLKSPLPKTPFLLACSSSVQPSLITNPCCHIQESCPHRGASPAPCVVSQAEAAGACQRVPYADCCWRDRQWQDHPDTPIHHAGILTRLMESCSIVRMSLCTVPEHIM